jgi:protocatechuate 3,4-dioxygenase beta subunit
MIEQGRVNQPGGSPRTRREVLGLLGGVGAAIFLAGCTGDDGSTAAKGGRDTASSTTTSGAGATTTTGGATATLASCTRIPEETAGPYPGDGSNGPNVLNQSGVVRRDIRSSFGSSSMVASGVPLTLDVSVYDSSKGCVALPGAAVYVWHCDMNGNYSMYSQGVTNENFLRGVQVADANGRVSFTSIFPGAYAGRWPHIHFEVFRSVAEATTYRNKIATSQFAMPADVCSAVYATNGYSQSLRNLSQTSLARDMVFSDGYSLQLPTFTGTTSGYTATIPVAVSSVV